MSQSRHMSVRNKYFAKAIDTPDGRFHSKGEFARWCDLKLLQQAGVVSDLRRQVPFVLESRSGAKIGKIVIDFTYSKNGERYAEDFKGMLLDLARYKLNHFAADHPDIRVIITSKGKPAKRIAA